ncbi:Oidioi.mRNA.OKI2018_I69.PAR.g12522.t1.cds [Oikopleura dioica]|uniref:Oidioi.mRNA.OKI2018_I69.PAR.g12522.t1.cds n=1 Tax=Oikopleura dioica TaxID=34765 RepID=A0ABN7S849_OIKDI|nr:Oidioi.mRNA.OKI2018_I69.PAR.g12522.t1.cds [Oikopleura dioica]
MENGRFKSKFGYELETYKWKPEGTPKFVFYLCHGYGEWAGNHGYTREFLPKLLELGAVVFSHDHYAHGKSGPFERTHRDRCQIKSFDETASDLCARIKIAREEYPALPCLLLGCSMGGLISFVAVMNEKPDIDGLMLLAPAIQIDKKSAPAWLRALGRVIGFIYPSMKSPLPLDLDLITRNKEHAEWIKKDIEEYGDNGGYDCGFALRMLKAQEKIQAWIEARNFPKELPVVLFTGTKDEICTPEGCYFAEKNIEALDPKSMMATDKAWCGTTTEENQAPLDELVLLPGGNDVTFFGGRYYAEFNPQVSNELECSIDVMFRTHGQITVKGSVDFAGYDCEEVYAKIQGQKICGQQEINRGFYDQNIEIVFVGNVSDNDASTIGIFDLIISNP